MALTFEKGIFEIGCMAHARRKFHDLHVANKSRIAEQALSYVGFLYDIECHVVALPAEERLAVRQAQAKPIIDKLHQ